MMEKSDLSGVLEFLSSAQALKATVRSSWTSAGRQESVAEHTWRVCLMALLIHQCLSDVDFTRLIEICIVHDMGEAIGGDVPAPEQVRRGVSKSADERHALLTLVAPLPARLRDEIVGLWDEYDDAATLEARLAKGLDKLETIPQHTQGLNPPDFDYRFNLAYGRQYTEDNPTLSALRTLLDDAARQRAVQNDARR